MSIFEKVLGAHNTIIALETGKKEQIQDITAQRYTSIGGRMYPIDPAQKAAAAKQVQLNYDVLIDTKKNEIRTVLETAEKEAKKQYYNALPMGSDNDYTSEIDRIIRNHENSTLHPNVRDGNFFATVREHTELGDKWALIYVLAGLELFPGNAELLECLDIVAPEVARAKEAIAEVETAKRLAEVFELAYFGAKTVTTTLESIHIKNRLAELGANPNITIGVDNAAVYDAFCQSLGVKHIEPEVKELAGEIGNDYVGLRAGGHRSFFTDTGALNAGE